MSDKERRSSLASIAARGGRPHEDLQALVFGPSIKLDTIDNLSQQNSMRPYVIGRKL
jgi:hypothetical protein